MAISDYLMTRLALAQQARGLAAQTEQARAQREAAQGRQNMAYLNALLQTGAQVPGMIGDIGAAQGAAGIKEATTGLMPGEIAEGAAALPAGLGVASTLTGSPTAPAPAPTGATSALQIPPTSPTTPQADRTYSTEEFEKVLGSPGAIGGAPKEITFPATSTISPSSTEKSGAKGPAVSGTTDEMQSQMAGVPDVIKSLLIDKQILETPEAKPARAAAEKFIPPPPGAPVSTEAELKDVFAVPRTAEPIITTTGLRPPEQTGAIETITVPGLNIPVPRPSARTVPETAAAAEVLPSVNEELGGIKKEVEEIAKLEDPFVKAQGEFIKKLNSYEAPKYKVNVKDAADKIVEDAWNNKQPNAILNFLSFGQYNNNLENAKRIAKKMVAGEITSLRKQESDSMRKQFIETAKLEAQQIAMLQKEQNEKRKVEFKGSLKTLNPEKAVEKLQSYNQVDRDFQELEAITRKMIANKIPFPGGKDFNKLMSNMKSFIAAPTESSAGAVNASLGALGVGAGSGVSISQGARGYNIPELQAAINGLQQANMDDTAKAFLKQQLLLAQTVGKAREGGRMTDADLKFYVDNLFMDNANKPSSLLESINRLKKVNANSQNDWLNIYNSLYPDMNLPFSMLSPAGFTDEEFAAANAIGWYNISPEALRAAQSAERQPSFSQTASSASSALKDLMPPAPAAPAPGATPPPRRQNKPGATPPKGGW